MHALFRDCFIDADMAQTLDTFCKAAIVTHPSIRRSKISERLWSQYIFDLGEAFCSKRNHCTKRLVACVGKQPGSRVWVLGPNIQIDEYGNLINEEDFAYYW